MTVLGAMDAAFSGLSAQQVRLNTVGDNLANVSTPGFKTARVDFSTLLAETLRAGSAPEGELGGWNSLQVGTGVQVSSVTRDFGQGLISPTGLSGDLAIDGGGFFILEGGIEGTAYTRDGTFALNPSGQLFDPASGFLVQGLNADLTTFTIPPGAPLETVVVPIGLVVGTATLVDFSVLGDGTVLGLFSDSSTATVGRLMLARFVNPQGLEADEGTRFRETAASGPAFVAAPGTQGLGTVAGGSLEESNVDLLGQFEVLIEAQRAFQANARVIQRSETILEELLNLVRRRGE